ncbi:MAG: rRNA synthase [Bacillota bacterium]|nr:rRNA synthase [Bacillota bacterium]MDK2960055.1 rRNA synthase [Bacillota bacterium]
MSEVNAGEGLRRVFTGQEETVGMRLDVFLAGLTELGLSRSQVQQLIREGRVKVDGRPAKPSLRLAAGTEVEVIVPPPAPADLRPEAIPLNIVYEDEHLVVLDKPAGLVVHPAPGHPEGTLVNALLAHCGSELAGIGGVLRPGIVHRLDKDTSGLMVVAKSEAAHQGLSAAIKARQVERVYLALAFGELKADVSMVDAPIGRHPVQRKKMAVVERGGRPARTRLRVLERFPGYTYLEATLETGRTHQIRVHLAFIGHPVVGDPVYGRRQGNLGLKRQFLHAARLKFTHPVSGEVLSFSSPLPEELALVLARLRREKEKDGIGVKQLDE